MCEDLEAGGGGGALKPDVRHISRAAAILKGLTRAVNATDL